MKRTLHSIGPDGERRAHDVTDVSDLPITQKDPTMQTPTREHKQQPPPVPSPAPTPTPTATPKTTTGVMAAQLPSGEWQCILYLDGTQHTKGPMPRRLFLREYHRALEQLNERVLRCTGAPRG